MEAIRLLMKEHRLIELVCDALLPFAGGERREQADDRAELQRFVAFFRGFADECHHRKEEDILFRAMIAAGLPRHGGPVAVILLEHDEVRRYVAALQDLAALPRPWSTADRDRLVHSASAYAELLFEHIRKEDAILYPLAEQHLPPEAKAQVDSTCARFDVEQAAGVQRLRLLGEDLVSRHAGAPRAVTPLP